MAAAAEVFRAFPSDQAMQEILLGELTRPSGHTVFVEYALTKLAGVGLLTPACGAVNYCPLPYSPHRGRMESRGGRLGPPFPEPLLPSIRAGELEGVLSRGGHRAEVALLRALGPLAGSASEAQVQAVCMAT